MPDAYKAGLEHIRAQRFFAAHEELELAWRAAAPAERDFYQGLVHVAVAWYQAGRGNTVGATRQLEKGLRRLERYEPEHRGIDVAGVRRQLRTGPECVSARTGAFPPAWSSECLRAERGSAVWLMAAAVYCASPKFHLLTSTWNIHDLEDVPKRAGWCLESPQPPGVKGRVA